MHATRGATCYASCFCLFLFVVVSGLALSTETPNVVNNTQILLKISQRGRDMTRGERVGVVIDESGKRSMFSRYET